MSVKQRPDIGLSQHDLNVDCSGYQLPNLESVETDIDNVRKIVFVGYFKNDMHLIS